MQIVYHLGAHCTDEDRLLRCLLRNRGVLAERGVVVPGPARYRKLLRDTAIQLKGARASIEEGGIATRATEADLELGGGDKGTRDGVEGAPLAPLMHPIRQAIPVRHA
ncbi:MAG: hypothetical protein V4516_14445, partial [Pseudomonadota bacterium]